MMGLAGKLMASGNANLGVNWTYQPQLSTTGWGTTSTVNAISWNSSVFCAVSSTGKVATSSDGATWSYNGAIPGIGSNPVKCIAWNGSVFCVSGSGGYIATSSDGITWTNRGILPSAPTTCYSIAWNGSVFCVSGSGGYIATSSDGITWTYQSQLSTTTWATSDGFAIAAQGSKFCVVGTDGVNCRAATSTDNGVNWTYQAGLASATISIPYCITSNGTIFCVGAASGKIATSSDGASWTYQSSLSASAWGSGQTTSRVVNIAWSGSKFCVVGGIGTGSGGKVATSPDGITWTYQPNLSSTTWGTTVPAGIAAISTKFVVGGNAGSIATSP
jgi:hypothetical protein